jgi:hypothetical protein
VQQRHQHANLKGVKGQGFEIEAPVGSKGTDESEMKEIEAGEAPVRNGLHGSDSNRLQTINNATIRPVMGLLIP